MERKSKGTMPYKMKGHTLPGIKQRKGSVLPKITEPTKEEFPGLLPEVEVSGGKKTVPGTFIQDESGSSIVGSSIEHGELREKKKKNTLTSGERKRLRDLDIETGEAYWKSKGR